MSNPFSQINGYNYTNPYISNHTGYNGFTGPPGNQTNTQYQDNSNLVNNLQFGQSPGLSSPQQSVQYPQIQVCKPSDSPNYNGVHSSPQNSSFNSSFGNLPSGGQPSPHLGNLPSGGQPSPHHGNLPSVGQQSPHLGNLPSGGQPSPQTNQGSLPLFPPASPLFPPVSPLYNPPPISPTLNALASSAANAFNPAVSPVTPQVQGLPSPVLPKRPNNSVPSRAQPSGTEIKNSPQSSTGARAVSPTEQFLQELLNLEKDYKVPPQTNDTPVKTQSGQDQVVASNFQSQQQGHNFQNHQAGASFQNHSTNFRNPQPNNFRNPQPTNFRNPQPNAFPSPQQNNFQSPQQNNFQSAQQTPQQNNFQSPQQTNTSFANQQQTNFQPQQQPNNFTNFQNQQNNFSNQATPSNSFNNFNQNWQQGATPTPLKKEPLPAHQSFPSYNFPQNAAHQPQPAHQNHNRTLSVNVNNLHGNPQTPLRPQNSPARSLPGPPDLVHYQQQQQLQKSQQAALEQKQQQSQQALKQKQQQLQQLQQQQRLYQQQNQQLIQQRLHNPQNPRFPNQIRQRPAFPNQTSIPNQIPHRPRFQNQVPVPNRVPAQLRYPGQVPPPNVGPRPPQFRNLNKQTNFPPQAVPGSRQLPPYRPGYSGPRPIPRGVTPQSAHHPQFPRLPPGQPIPGKAQQFQYLQQRHPELLAAFQHRNPRGAVPLPRNPANFRPGLPPRLQQRPGFRPGLQQSPQFRPRAAETIVRVEISPEQLNRQDQQEAWKRAEAFLKTERRNRDQQQQIVSGAQPAPRGRQGSWHQPEFGTAPQPTFNALPPSISIQKLPRDQTVPTAEIFNPLRDLPDSLTIKRIANNNAAVQIKRERRNSAPDVTRVVDIQELLRERREKQDKAKEVEEQNPAKETTPVEEPPPVFAGPLQDYVQERKEAQEAAIRVKRERLNSDPTDSASTNAAELFAQRRAAEEVAKKVKRERFSPPPNLESLYTTAASESATSLTVATSETGANTESQPGPTPLQVKRERHSPFQSSKTTTPETTVTSSQDYFTNKDPPQKSSFVDSLDLEVRTLIQKRKADTEAAVKVKREKLSPASEELNALQSQTEAPVLDQSLNLAKYGLTAPQNYKTFAAEASEKPNSSEERPGKKEERLKVKREAYSPPPPPLITNEICESRNEELFRPDPDRQRSISSAEIQTFSGENTDKDMSGNPPKLPPGISVQRSQSQSSPMPNLPPGISLSRDSRDSRDSPNLPPGISFSRSQESKLSNLPSGIQVHRPSSAESSSSMDRLAGLGIQISRPAEERSSPRSNDMDRPPPKKNDMDRLSRLGISVSPSVDQAPRSEHSASPMAARLAGLGVTTSSVTEQSGSPMASRLSGLGVSVSGGLPGVSVSGGMPGISMTPMGDGPRKKPENGSNSSPGSRHSTPPSTPVRSPIHTQHFQPPEKGGPPPHHMSGPPTNMGGPPPHHMGGPPPNMGGPSPYMGGPPPQKGGPPPLAKPVAQRPAPAPLPDNEDMDTTAMEEEEEEDEKESPKENGSASPQEGTEDAAVISKPEDAGNLNEGPKKGKKKGKRGRSPNKSPNKSPRGDTSGESTERSPRVSRGRPKPNVSYEEVPDEYEMMDMDDMEPPLKIAAEKDEASKKKTEVQNNKDNKDKTDSKEVKDSEKPEGEDSEKPEDEDSEKPEGEDSEKPEGEEADEKKSPEGGKDDTKGKEDKAKENESTEGGQDEENWEGYEGYEGEEGWEGYEGYEEGAEGWEGYEGYEGEQGYEGYEGYEEGDESEPKEKDDTKEKDDPKDKKATENKSKKKDTESLPEEDDEEEEGETIDNIKKFVKDGEAEKKDSDENTDKETEGGIDLLKMAEDAEKAASPKDPPPAQPPHKPQAPSNLPKGLSNISFSRLESPDDSAKNDHVKKPGPSPTLPLGISMTNLPPGISASPIPNLPPGISVSSPANLPNLPAGISVSSPANNLPPGISISPFKKPSSSIRQSFDQDDNRSISSQDRDTSYDRGDSDYDDSRSTHSMDNIDRTPKVGSETSCVFCFNKCGDRRPKLLTCLHTACSICFMDKLAAAKADRHSSDVIDIDGDGIQMAPEVTCGLCKATTFEDETIDNLFISACDGEEDKGDETPNYCNSCEEGALATTWCNDCEEYLCRDCVRAHMRVKMTKDHQVTSVSTGMSGSAPATYNYCTIHKNEKLSLYCETCDSLNCRDCQLSEKHRNHTYRYGYEVAPEVKASLMQSLSDIKMKKNVLEEGRGILGTKISEINIKERSLLTQLKDVKNFLVSKIEARHKELTTLVTNRVRERRKVLEGRKSNVDRAYNQAEYGTAFVENAINGNVEDEKILLTKKMMQRQLKKLKRSNNSADLRPNEMEFKLDLYFQHFSGQNLHSNLDNVLKMVMSDITVSDIAPEPPKPKPKPTPPPAPSPAMSGPPMRPQNTTPQKNVMGGPGAGMRSPQQGMGRGSPARGTPVGRQMTPQKQIVARSPIRQPSPARPGQQQMTMVRGGGNARGGRGRPPMQNQGGVRMQGGRGMQQQQSPGRGSMTRGGMTRGGMQYGSSGSTIQRGRGAPGMAGRGMPQSPVRGSMTRGGGMQGGRGAMQGGIVRGRGGTIGRAGAVQQITRGVRPQMGRGGGGGGVQRPMMIKQQPGLRPAMPTIRSAMPAKRGRPAQHQQQNQQYTNAVLGLPTPQGAPPNWNQTQGISTKMQGNPNDYMHSQPAPPYMNPAPRHPAPRTVVPQQPPGSSWHTPSAATTNIAASTAAPVGDIGASFKIKLPSMGRGKPSPGIKKENPEIIDLDDGPPPLAVRTNNPGIDTLAAQNRPGLQINRQEDAVDPLAASEQLNIMRVSGGGVVRTLKTEPNKSANVVRPNSTQPDSIVAPDFSSLMDDDVGASPDWIQTVPNESEARSHPMVQIMPGDMKSEPKSSSATVELPPTGAGIKLELGSAPVRVQPPQTVAPSSNKRPLMEGSATKEKADGDWCAVCHDGGDTLYCCDNCPKVYHLYCYVPPLMAEPPDDWVCLMCSTIDDILSLPTKVKKGRGNLSERDLKMCRRLLFEMYNLWPESVPFRDCADLNFPQYLEKIKDPIALDVIKERLDEENADQYSSIREFLADLRKMFRNCFLFNSKESEIYRHAKRLEEKLDQLLEQWLPDFAFDPLTDLVDKPRPSQKRAGSPQPGPSKKRRVDQGGDFAGKSKDKKKKKKKKKKHSRKDESEDSSDMQEADSDVSDQERNDYLIAMENSLQT